VSDDPPDLPLVANDGASLPFWEFCFTNMGGAFHVCSAVVLMFSTDPQFSTRALYQALSPTQRTNLTIPDRRSQLFLTIIMII
jgi:hypothetical protein